MAVINLNKDNFTEEVMQSDIPVLIDFWSPTCMPCKMLAPIIDELAEEVTDVKICKVDVSAEPMLTAQFGIRSVPTLLVIKDGKTIETSVGYIPKDEVLKLIEN